MPECRQVIELPDEWVAVFDDMVRVQQRTERERDELRAENERLKSVEIARLEAEVIAHVDEIERLRERKCR